MTKQFRPPVKRLGRGWKETAAEYARQLWHTPEYRYWGLDSATAVEIAQMAGMAYRSQLSSAYRSALRHPKGTKDLERVRVLARELARVGEYLLTSRVNTSDGRA